MLEDRFAGANAGRLVAEDALWEHRARTDAMTVVHILALLIGAASVAGLFYQAAAAWLLRSWMAAPRERPTRQPPISVLKPLFGDEPGLGDNLRSLCRQDYPTWQVVCGTLDPADLALAVAARVADEFPTVDLVAAASLDAPSARNRKVANLIAMLPRARHEVVAMADADVRVDARYLSDLAEALARPGAGAATCLYVGRPEPGIWSRLGALGINFGFLPSALVARALGRRDGCFGATIAIARETLDRAGGLAPLADRLADDWALGAAVRRLGLGIELAARPVEIVVDEPGLGALFAHELRWGRTVAAIDRPAYLASILAQPTALAALCILAAGAAWPALVLFVAACLVRYLTVRVQARALGIEAPSPGLLALREILTFAVFAGACWGRTVSWRGARYRVGRDGRMEPVEVSAP